ncbi:unnamed protein product [Rotaria sordida]|uniref:Uncharacterized protein n=1 Tax=Rotaria sordida TaxID=392033 RepID=A0A815M997_9BILA|nr:unnamed protein product [Rotaria sordida]CAF1421420.1 unnamed protein product [Rotaria sordida]
MSGKSFENEYHLIMKHIDITILDEDNLEKILGLSKNIILNKFIIKSEYLCYYEDLKTNISSNLIVLVKSAFEN